MPMLPHVTVACIVHAEDKFLVVEETINGKSLWNQPAGHPEADETLAQAAARELWEETGITASTAFIRIVSVIAPIRPSFLRFYSLSSLISYLRDRSHDNDIDCRRWVNADEILNAPNCLRWWLKHSQLSNGTTLPPYL